MKFFTKIRFSLLLIILVFGCVNIVLTQSKSRIVGEVRDAATGEVLIGANVVLLGTHLGASTDVNGKYFIVSVPVGTHKVKASMMGYREQIVTNVVVSADQVTTVNIKLQSGDIQLGAVVVTANQDELHKEVSNTQIVVDSRQIVESAGIREINNLLAKQPGIGETNGYLTIRGGSADQTGTMVNGISYNNAANGNAETSIPLSAIDQVSVLSGGFNAEYGNFRSGLINVTTKSGTKDGYHGTLSFQRNFAHLKRFGSEFYDAHSPILTPYLDASVAFTGNADSNYSRNPYRGEQFGGWNNAAAIYNINKPAGTEDATPLDMYLLSSWLFMTQPDYEGLAKLGYTVSDEQKQLFAQHSMKEGDGVDKNFDGGFGGPLPLIGQSLGDATFFISNNSSENYYVMPMAVQSEKKYTTLGTIKMEPSKSTTLSLTGLWKVQEGLSRIWPPDPNQYPDASRNGGFMPIDNVGDFSDNGDYTYYFDPPRYPILKQTTLLGGITINHVFSQSTFAELSLNYLKIGNSSPTGDNRDTTMITNFGPFYVDEMPYGKWGIRARKHEVNGYTYPSYDRIQGFPSFRWFGKEGDLHDNSTINQFRGKFDITSQVDEHNYLKAGIEYNRIHINNMLWLWWNQFAKNSIEFNYDRTPSQSGAYIQDQITASGIIANLGLRADYFYGGGGVWPSGDPWAVGAFSGVPTLGQDSVIYDYFSSGGSVIWDKFQQYDSAHPGFLQPVKNFFTLSPRIGLSFPVTENSKFYFNYGHFRSNPPYYSMYLLQYRLDDSKEGLNYMSNPNLEPPRTISYELGVAYNFYSSYTARLSGYYKDVTGQNGRVTYKGSETIVGSTVGTLNYDGWLNNNYQDIQGLELNLSKNDNTWLNGTLNFNYQLSKSGMTGVKNIMQDSTASLPQNQYQGQETRALPRPEVNATVTFRMPHADDGASFLGNLLSDWTLTLFGQWNAGSFISTDKTSSSSFNPLNLDHLTPFLQWPSYFMVDMKLNKAFTIAGVRSVFSVDVNNLFNIKVNQMNTRDCFSSQDDMKDYLSSLRLPEYSSSMYNGIRIKDTVNVKGQPVYGKYLPGDDSVGDLRSGDKPYINDPDYSFWVFGQPREIWVGMRVEF
jgi:outer membrane receptor protein involved in Fe transport